jgi:hypothetical protein
MRGKREGGGRCMDRFRSEKIEDFLNDDMSVIPPSLFYDVRL